MWRLRELSAKHGRPFQIHTGDGRIQGSNPMLLVDLLAANPKTKFILFYGSSPWIGETGTIVVKAMQSANSARRKTVSHSTRWIRRLSGGLWKPPPARGVAYNRSP
jgi:predicted TIM-barrel fold metal-dependent hydrolase